MQLLVLCVELIVLNYLSRAVTMRIFGLFMLLFRVRSVAISLLLALQFPGTVIHELSHLFTAEVFGVKTGRMRLEPESIRGDSITAGSVMIAESDPFRRYAIGLAPLFWGIFALSAVAYFLPSTQQWGYAALLYLIFAVSNTMFPSPEDVKGFWPFFIVLALFVCIGYGVGLRFQLSGFALQTATSMLDTLVKSLGIVIGMNCVILAFGTVFFNLLRRT